VHEAAQLQKDLRRAGIEPFGWVVNQSMAPLHVSDPVLVSRRAQEARYLDEVRGALASRTVLIGLDLGPAQVKPQRASA
jgi:arsenite-transporting ATPase